jgi:hypothetical protein
MARAGLSFRRGSVMVAENHALVELAVNGRVATFLPDTGAERKLFSARELGLARDELVTHSDSAHGVVDETAETKIRTPRRVRNSKNAETYAEGALSRAHVLQRLAQTVVIQLSK